MRLRVLTLNIAHGRGQLPYQGMLTRDGILRQMRKIGSFIQKWDPDVVCLQEVDRASHWNRRVDLLAEILDRIDLEHHYHGIHNLRSGRLPLAYGNAVLSRFPIVASRAIAFGDKTLGEKGFAFVELKTPAGVLPVLNVHLDYRSRIRRVEQVQRVLDELRPSLGGGPGRLKPIVCGDFNTSDRHPGDAVRALFTALHGHHRYAILPQGGRTFPAFAPVRSLDFILAPETFETIRHEVVRTLLSDHLPVLADFRIGG